MSLFFKNRKKNKNKKDKLKSRVSFNEEGFNHFNKIPEYQRKLNNKKFNLIINNDPYSWVFFWLWTISGNFQSSRYWHFNIDWFCVQLFIVICFIISFSVVVCWHLQMVECKSRWHDLNEKDSNILFFWSTHTPSTMEGRCAFCNNAVVISGVMENGKLYHPKCTPSARGIFLR